MKISELVKRLLLHPNQDADINLSINIINGDLEEFDEKAELTIVSEDSFYNDFIEIVVTPKILKDEADVNNNIHTFLTDNFSKLNIEIDVENGIYITDKDGGLLREIDFEKSWLEQHDNEDIINEILLKLRKIL